MVQEFFNNINDRNNANKKHITLNMEIDDENFFGEKNVVKTLSLKSEKRWRLVKKTNQEVKVLDPKTMESRKIKTNKNRLVRTDKRLQHRGVY